MVVTVPPVASRSILDCVPALSVVFPEILSRELCALRLQGHRRRRPGEEGSGLLSCQLSGRRVPVRLLPGLNRPPGPRAELPIRRPRVESFIRERGLDAPALVLIRTDRFSLSVACPVVPAGTVEGLMVRPPSVAIE